MQSLDSDHGLGGMIADRLYPRISDIASRHNLAIQWTGLVEVDLSCTIDQQSGLDFTLWFALSHDEVTFGGDGWYAAIFLADDGDEVELILATFEGLITGDTRILLYTAIGRSKPYWSVVQLCQDGRWANVSTGVGCAFPPVIRPSILRNGHGTAHRQLSPAWGSMTILAGLLAISAYWLN